MGYLSRLPTDNESVSRRTPLSEREQAKLIRKSMARGFTLEQIAQQTGVGIEDLKTILLCNHEEY